MGHRRRVAVAIAASAAVVAFGKAAGAAPQTFVALDYEVAPDVTGCPDVEEFRAGVARQLHYDPFRPAADRRVAVQIARKEVGFDGRIRWTDAEGNWVGDRRLTSRRPDCDGIAASLAFSVAVQVQLLAAIAPPAPATPPGPPAAPPAADASSTVVARPSLPPGPPATEPPAGKRSTWSFGLGPALALGVSPAPTGVARIFVRARRSRLSLEAAFDGAWPATRQETGGSGFSLDRFAGAGAACGHTGAFAGCVTGTLGVLRARGTGVDTPRSPVGLFSQLGARIAATLDFGDRYFAAARVDGLVMLSPWTVTLNDAAAWTTPRVGALVGLDVGAHF